MGFTFAYPQPSHRNAFVFEDEVSVGIVRVHYGAPLLLGQRLVSADVFRSDATVETKDAVSIVPARNPKVSPGASGLPRPLSSLDLTMADQHPLRPVRHKAASPDRGEVR